SPADQCGYLMAPGYAFCGHPKADIAPDGRSIAFVAASVAGADSGSYRVTVMSASGDTVFARSRRFVAAVVPQRLGDSAAAIARKGPERPPIPGTEPTIAPPHIYPPVEGIVMGRDGTVWVELRATAAGKPYDLFDAHGTFIGSVLLPANTTVKAATRS